MLPNDFNEILSRVQAQGILEEDSAAVSTRLTEAIETASLQSGQGDLGFSWTDWVNKTRNLLASIHNQLCDQDKKCVKEDYKDLLNLGLTPGGIATVSAAISSLINPALAVSSVLIFAAIWLLKRGLNQWCSLPA